MVSSLPNLAMRYEVEPGVFEFYAEPGRWFPPHSVYALHAGDFNYRYVGQSEFPHKRLAGHLYYAKKYPWQPVGVWINQIGAENLVMDILDSPEGTESLRDRERYWVWHLLDLGYSLLNRDDHVGAWHKQFNTEEDNK